MTILQGVTFLAADTSRSQAYAQAMRQAELIPEYVLIFGVGAGSQRGSTSSPLSFQRSVGHLFLPDLSEPLEQTVQTLGCSFEILDVTSIKATELFERLSDVANTTVIYSGFGGEIVPERICRAYCVLHVHTGWLPDYAGSTTLYYSLLNKGYCAASAFLLNEAIDQGDIIERRKYPAPPPGIDLDHLYDSAVRSDLLIKVLKNYAAKGVLPVGQPQDHNVGRMHYVIHPVLKNIVRARVDEGFYEKKFMRLSRMAAKKKIKKLASKLGQKAWRRLAPFRHFLQAKFHVLPNLINQLREYIQGPFIRKFCLDNFARVMKRLLLKTEQENDLPTNSYKSALSFYVSSAFTWRLKALEIQNDGNVWSMSDLPAEQLAEIAILHAFKSDFVLAKKLLIQADITSYCESWALKAYDELRIRESKQNALAVDDVGEHSPPFDFLIIHSGQAGTTATQNFLCLHPELLVTQKSEMDVAIETCQEHALAKKYRQRIAAASVPIRAGIVQHGYIVGTQGSKLPSGREPGPEIVDRLSKIVRRECFYHLVRNPLEVLTSIYNHYIINQFAGGYSFPGSMNHPAKSRLSFGPSLSWPSSWAVPRKGLPKSWVEQRMGDRKNKIEQSRLIFSSFALTENECDEAGQHVFKRMGYTSVGKAYGRLFEKWIPIDTAELAPGKSQHGLAKLFDQLGVNSNYSNPIFGTQVMSLVRRAMLNNVVNLTGLAHPLYVQLDYAGQALYSHTFSSIELARMEPDNRWKSAGFENQPISLVARLEQWVLQPTTIRKRLLEERVFQFILENVLVPAWIDCYLVWKREVGRYQIENWQQFADERSNVFSEGIRHLKNDIELFMETHPDFLHRWSGIKDFL